MWSLLEALLYELLPLTALVVIYKAGGFMAGWSSKYSGAQDHSAAPQACGIQIRWWLAPYVPRSCEPAFSDSLIRSTSASEACTVRLAF